MFTREWMEELETPFREQMRRMGKKAEEVSEALDGCGEPARDALKCLYASMPLCDALDYSPALFLSFARHGAFLWENGPFAGRVPEEVFAAYVLYHRVNDEDLTEHRAFFYEKLKDRISGTGMEEAVLRVNDWCASQVTYRSTDERTAGPLCVYRSAFGRCGEESAFAVSVLRSLGIPARQVYVPLWSHCDDNHAWMEAWCDGKWVFLGACEPEAAVNRGWFTGAASRAMLVRSRWMLPVGPKEENGIISRGEDLSCSLNHLDRYAAACDLRVTVYGPGGEPLEDARVGFEVMNQAAFGEIAFLRTGRDGSCLFRTGRGSLHVTARRGSLYGECMAEAGEGSGCVVRLEDRRKGGFRTEGTDAWEDLVILAPGDADGSVAGRPEEEIRRKAEKTERAARLRRDKEGGIFDPALAERAAAGLEGQERETCLKILEGSRGNQAEIAGFLLGPAGEGWTKRRKTALLACLREKDWRDVTADVLADACLCAPPRTDVPGDACPCVPPRTDVPADACPCAPPRADIPADACPCAPSRPDVPESGLAIPFVLCPRVRNEMLRPHRAFLLEWLGREDVRESVRKMRAERKAGDGAEDVSSVLAAGRPLPWAGEEIRRDPFLAWRLVQERIRSDKRTEYGELVSSARAALESGYGSELTQRTVCVQLLRTLGIPARLGMGDGVPEAWVREGASSAGGFIPLGRENRRSEICVRQADETRWSYRENWTLARMEDTGWKTLFTDKAGEGTDGVLSVLPGQYRILTANRLPCGNILAKQMIFSLKEGERREVGLKLAQAAPSDLFTAHRISDFALRGEDGTDCPISGLVKDRDGLFLWLGEDEEPTEHILAEIDQNGEEYAKRKAGLYFVAASYRVRENPILARILSRVGTARFFLDDFGGKTEALARRMYLEPGRLPLAVLVSPDMVGVYGVAGYHVGAGEMILKLLRLREEAADTETACCTRIEK